MNKNLKYITVGRLTIRKLNFKNLFLFYLYSFRSLMQAKFSKGNIHASIMYEDGRHYWTKTAWDSKENSIKYMSSKSHKIAMQKTKEFANRTDFITWEGETIPKWAKSMELLKEELEKDKQNGSNYNLSTKVF